ncbi:MAG: ABC transporter substrate-binding protein [Syntrophomonadaceae bacterium]|jgi:branched-chain amino acid transport system substrate-binding protein
MNLAFSTGLIQNVSRSDGMTPYPFFVVKVTNNNRTKRFKARVILYSLPRKRRRNISVLTIRPLSSLSATFDISQLSQFQIDMVTILESYNIEVSVFWKDASGNLISYQERLESELELKEDEEAGAKVDPQPDFDVEAQADPGTEPEPARAAEEPEPEPEPKPEEKTISEIEPEPRPEEEVGGESETEPQPEEETFADTEPESRPEEEVDSESETEPQPEEDTFADTEPESRPEEEVDNESEPEPDDAALSEIRPEPESEPVVEPELEVEADTEAEPETETEPIEESEAEPEAEEDSGQKADKERRFLPRKLEPVKIGAIYPLSGTYAPFGERIRQAVELAAELINNYYNLPLPLAQSEGLANLKNRKIKILWADSQGSPAIGRMEARRLVEEEGAVALLGCFQSNVTAMASLQAEVMQIPFLNPESPSALLTQRGFKWFFRTCPDETALTQLYFDMFTYLKEKGIQTSPMAILSDDSPSSVEASALEINLGRSLDIWLALEMYHDLSKSLKAEMNRLLGVVPKVIISHQQLPGVITVIETLKSLNRFPEGLVAQNTDFILSELIEQAGSKANYIISRAAWTAGLGERKPLAHEVNTLYRDKYNQDLDEVNAQSFTGMLVLADAINRARNTNPIDIRNALARTFIRESKLIMPWQGVEFDQNGQNALSGGLVTQIIDQQIKIVWPLELAESKLIWPAPTWEER